MLTMHSAHFYEQEDLTAIMKIWIARHGQTDLNLVKRMQGRTDCPLNERGIRQAEKSRKMIGEICFDAVYASPLQRAQVTSFSPEPRFMRRRSLQLGHLKYLYSLLFFKRFTN